MDTDTARPATTTGAAAAQHMIYKHDERDGIMPLANTHSDTVDVPEALKLHYFLDAAGANVKARFKDTGATLRVVQLNLASAVVQHDAPGALPSHQAELDLHIGYACFPGLKAEVVALRDDASLFTALRFQNLAHRDAVTMLRLLHGLLERGLATGPTTTVRTARIVVDPSKIMAIVSALARHRSEVQVRSRTGALWRGRLLDFDAGRAFPLQLTHEGPDIEAPFQVDIVGYNTVFRGQVLAGEVDGRTLWVPLPGSLERFGHRQRRRVQAPDGHAIRFQHPLWPADEVIRSLRDMGTRGVAVWTDPDRDLLFPGLQIPAVELLRDGAVISRGAAVVCHLSWLPLSLAASSLWPAFAGLAFVPNNESLDRAWLATVHQHLHPVARSGGYWKDFSWHVYEKSGYFRLSGKQPLDFHDSRPSFLRTSGRIDAAPWLGIQAVWPSERGIEATFTFVKIYKRTWFGFQLAKWPGAKDVTAPSQQVLLDLYKRAFEHMQHDPHMRWIAGYLEANVPWNKVAQFRWAADMGSSGGAVLSPFQLLEAPVDVAGFSPGGDTSTWVVTDATQDEAHQFARHLATFRSASWLDLLDLTAERIHLTDTQRLWHAASMRRDRRLLVARRDGELMAIAVAETGEDGVSLFSLLDSVRLFVLKAGGEAGFAALLRGCSAWFAALSKPHFCIFHHHDDDGSDAVLAHLRSLGARDLGPGRLWAVHRDFLPDFLEHIHALLAPKPTRREPVT